MSFKDWLERLDPWSNLISLLVGIIGTVATLATLSSNPRGEISYQGNIIRLIDADRVANSLTVSASKDHGISQNVLEDKAYAAWEQPPSPQAIHELAAAAAKSEQEVIKEYSQVYRSANGEGDPWEPPHIL